MEAFEGRIAVGWAALSVLVLLGGSFASVLLPSPFQAIGVGASVVAYICCGRRALASGNLDARFFVPHSSVDS